MRNLNDDWRNVFGEHLKGYTYKFKKYISTLTNDHDHCEFCMEKFMQDNPECEHEGYTTLDNYYWICKECFDDFKEILGFKLEG